MIPDFILFIAEMFLAFIAGLTFIDYIRKQDRPRLDIALMFASLGIPAPFLALGLFIELDPVFQVVPILILLFHPYLILRLVRHFRPLSTRLRRLAMIGSIITSLVYIPGALLPRDSWVVLVIAIYIVAYIILVESYVWVAFIREARRTTGVARHRLRFLAGGSIVIAVSFFMLFFTANLPGVPTELDSLAGFLSPLLAILLTGCYYLGFTPPTWLHRYWQLSELQIFLGQINNISINQPEDEVLDFLCQSAVRAVGGTAAAVAFKNKSDSDFRLHAPHTYEALDRLTIPEDGFAGRAWREIKPVLVFEAADFEPGDRFAADKVQAEAVYAIPIANDDDIYSLLLVYLPFIPLFPNDNITLLKLLTDRVALFSSFVTLIEKERKLVEDLNKNSKALIEARDLLEARVQERTADLATVNKELQQFTYIISHDLRSPLVNLRGFVTELKYSLKKIESILEVAAPHIDESDRLLLRQILDDELPESMDFISMAAIRMNNLVSTLLDLSRQGHRTLYFSWIDMEQLIDDTLKTLAHNIEEKDVQIKIGAMPMVYADEIAVEQIITNLVSNAINYLRPGIQGKISIKGDENEEEVTYHIMDNGRGIATKHKELVFAPFRRIGKSEVEGEGMGLAYVRALIRRHNGRIWFHSKKGLGTTFSFTLPKSQPEEETAETEGPA